MTQDAEQSWIAEGAQVAQYSTSGQHVILTKIEKVTATQIVLANGSRYRKDRLHREMGDRNTWSSRQLLPVDSWQVRQALAVKAVDTLTYELDKLLRVRSASAMPDDLLALLDQAQAKLTAARTKVAGLVTGVPKGDGRG